MGLCLRPAGLVALLISGFITVSGWAAEDIRFGWDDFGVAVEADGQTVIEVLDVVSAATGIPMLFDPSMTNRVSGLFRKRTLEDLLLSLSPGLAISYRFDERMGTHVIDQVYSSNRADERTIQSNARRVVVETARLQEGIKPVVERPVRYSGIGAAIRWTPDRSGIWIEPLSPNAPAARAGFELGDVVVAVDDRAIQTFTNFVDIPNAIRGPENTTVALTVRLPDGTTRIREVRREVFQWNPERTQ